MAVSNPLRGTIRPIASSRLWRPFGAMGPCRSNIDRSTPHGTIEVRVRRHPHAREFAHLIRAGCHDVIGADRDEALELDPRTWTGVGAALVAAFDRAEGVKGQDHRKMQAARGQFGGQPRHPEVRVHHIGAVGAPGFVQEVGELAQMRQYRVLGNGCARSGGHVDDAVAVLGDDLGVDAWIVSAGVDADLVPGASEGRCQRTDMHVLSPGIDTAERGEGAGVFGNHGDLHGAVPFLLLAAFAGARGNLRGALRGAYPVFRNAIRR